MFGISFTELMVILVVALVVVGPEQLPKVARTLGMLWARAQRYVNGVKADMARDMAIDEFREMQQQLKEEARRAEQALQQGTKSATQAVDQQVQEINTAAAKHLPAASETDQTSPKR
ncbi:MAG TPA: Sec-independent protein translocase protein TatB [Gallionellaceae bacterium]|nr:Sec-independent protein translocase protein TatB [Gallionellaceae bacterium]